MTEKSILEKQLKASLDEWKADIDKMEATARKASADAQAQYDAEIMRLREKHDEAQKHLHKVRESSNSAWDDVRNGAEESAASMRKAITDAWARLT